MFTEYHAHEMLTASERKLRNALKFGTAGKVNSQERLKIRQGSSSNHHNSSEVAAPQVELNGAVDEALTLHPLPQCLRTKLILDVIFDDPFLD